MVSLDVDVLVIGNKKRRIVRLFIIATRYEEMNVRLVVAEDLPFLRGITYLERPKLT